MPFESQAQRAFMYSRHPSIAKRWREESGPQKGLPEHKVKKSKSKEHSSENRMKSPKPHFKSSKSGKANLTKGYRKV